MITFGSDVGDLILQRTLSENTLGLNSAIERMTSGYKVNHAKDNAAGYSIITDLNTKISSMLQVQSNTENGLAMLQTAEGGLEEIQGLLERLRALAEQASNDSYGADAREAMQSEADEIIEEIERIRNSIEYNGMSLYETPREDAVTTAVNRLSASAKVSNAGEIYPKKHNDTQYTPAAFTLAVGGGVNTLASSSSVSLLSNDTIEGAVDFGASESKTINIDGVEYTVSNKLSTSQTLSYTKDTVTGELTFLGSDFTIQGQSDVAHNLIINGSRNSVYGGDLADTISTVASSIENVIYGGAGDDTISAYGSSIYGEDGNDTLTHISGSWGTVFGGNGDDIININAGFTGSSTAVGGSGNDIINISVSNSKNIRGSAGDDTFNILGTQTELTIDGGTGTNIVNGNIDGNTIINTENANAATIDFAANETKTVEIDGKKYTITNNTSASTSLVYQINAGQISFNKTNSSAYLEIRGETNQAHNVSLDSDNMTFYSGNQDDTIVINGSNAFVYSQDGNDTITINRTGAFIQSGNGNDSINVNTSQNYIDTGAGDDNVSINSSRNHNTIYSESGNNTITGTSNNTNLISGFGSLDTENTQSILLKPGESSTITIGGKEYTLKPAVTNWENVERCLFYAYNPVTEEVTFWGFRASITGQSDVEHNVTLYGECMVFNGGDKNDTITNYAHSGYVYGNGGDDTIILNLPSSWAYAYGGDGNDTIISYDGGSHIWGEAGDDTITINAVSIRQINGGDGDDTYNINAKATNISDTGGNNIYNINTDGANISGSRGNDTFYVNGNNNTVLGAGGDDYFVIDGDNNTIDGGTDNNYYIDNGSGTSMSNVNRGPNAGSLSFTYQGETKTFTLNGKTYTVTNNLSGSNTLQYSLNPNTGVITVNGSSLEISANTNETAILNIRGDNNVINGSNLDDRITIEQGSNNTINGLNGNDTLTSNSINNSLLGGIGNDTINLNASTNLTVDGGAGDDILNISSDNNTNIIAGAGKNTLNITGSNNTLTASDGDNRIVASGSSNSISLGEGNNNITITGSSNTLTAGSGNNTLGVQGNLNNITLDNAVDEVNIYGDENTVTANNGENSIVIRGDGNNYTTQNGNKEIEVRGDDNIIQGGSGIDDIRINGNNNTAKGGDSSDTFMVSQGNNNTIDGEGGDRNTLINNGNNTTFTNAVDITPRPFEVNIKVDIGSGDDKFISTEISFNLFDFSVDFSSSQSARESLEAIDDMLKSVNEQILNIGTTINRLETVLEAQSSKLENMISTRSTLRDADIAEESSSFIKYQILQQASATLIAASRNMRYENVLGLLGNINQ